MTTKHREAKYLIEQEIATIRRQLEYAVNQVERLEAMKQWDLENEKPWPSAFEVDLQTLKPSITPLREQLESLRKSRVALDGEQAIGDFIVTTYRGEQDNWPVIQIDGLGEVRVNMNDGAIWNADTENHTHDFCGCTREVNKGGVTNNAR